MVVGNYGTPLHQAVREGQVETAGAMLEEGCPLDVVDSARATVLHLAAEDGNVELLREFVGRGCDVNAVQANGCTPIHSAAVHGKTEAVQELIKLGAITSVVAGHYGTPLHLAALKGHVETVAATFEDVAVDDKWYSKHVRTPLEAQVPKCSIVGTCNSLGQTPIMWAVRCR